MVQLNYDMRRKYFDRYFRV